ncbi:MAG TPA: hypothetical protein VFS43_23530 [Polyangiaceae bacterium]|nr:hypothetical protein [Polyangiaceae bacterium]
MVVAARGAALALGAALAACGGGGSGGEGQPVLVPAAPPASGEPSPRARGAGPGEGLAEAAYELAIGVTLACARVSGRVHCGALDPERPLTAEPPLAGLDDAVSVALGRGYGGGFGCVATRRGGVSCFGKNSQGQLGAGLRAEQSERPVPVTGLSGARRVVAGDLHACALLEGGPVKCWGFNASGQVGSPVSYEAAARELVAPFEVAAAKGASQIALSRSASCALVDAGDLVCWGELPVSGPPPRPGKRGVPPRRLAETAGFSDLGAGEGGFCGVRQGEALCWGELGPILAGRYGVQTPQHPLGLTRVKRVRLGQLHACALHDDGRVSCWGLNSNGELGRGASSEGYEPLGPEAVRGLPPAVDLVVGGSISCAITAKREVYCWGRWPISGEREPRKEPRPIKVRAFE